MRLSPMDGSSMAGLRSEFVDGICLRALWVVPMAQPPLRNGCVTIRQGRVVSVTPRPPESLPVRDCGNSILLPALVNAHTHLEFSTLDQPFPANGNFVDWIRQVIAWRSKRDPFAGQNQAISQGSMELERQGCGLFGEISTAPWPADAYLGSIPAVLFLEQLGLGEPLATERLKQLDSRLRQLRIDPPPGVTRFGLSPHAPYSLSEELFEGMLSLANWYRLPVAMHLAESHEEATWIKSGLGPFADLQESLGIARSLQWRTPWSAILHALSGTERALVIHGNYLGADEWDLLSRASKRVSLVYCPRTHQHFGHPPYPLDELIRRSIRVVIGTDSRASSPDLSLFSELQTVRRLFPNLDSEVLVGMATSEAAKALGFEGEWGVIAPGSQARLISWNCPEDLQRNPLDWLLSECHLAPEPVNLEAPKDLN